MNKLFKISLITFLLTTSIGAQAAHLVSFVVADTKDEDIGDSVETDLRHIKNRVNLIARHTGLTPKTITIRGSKTNPNKVLNEIHQVRVNPEDVVLFYWSGHGFRTPAKGDSPWPNLFFSNTEEGIEYEMVMNLIEQKKPRLTITLVDACNNVIPENYAPPTYRPRALQIDTAEVKALKQQNYKQLFLGFKGKINITSSEAGEYSWGSNFGGLYTNAFLDSLDEQIELTIDPNWQDVLDNAAVKVSESEHPYYEVKVEEVELTE